MKYTLPHTIENCIGEKIIFKSIEQSTVGDKVFVDAFCIPGAGPGMHTHLKQEEELAVVSGKMAYQVLGQETKYLNVGETVLFKRGVPHKFWADGQEPLQLKGWLHPAGTAVFFLSSLYEAQNKSGNLKPETFDAAYLLTKYASEYDVPEIPKPVKKVVFPIILFIGQILGKYKHFRYAPHPLK